MQLAKTMLHKNVWEKTGAALVSLWSPLARNASRPGDGASQSVAGNLRPCRALPRSGSSTECKYLLLTTIKTPQFQIQKFPRSKVFAVPFHISVESSPIVFLFVTNAGDSVLLWFDIDIAIVKCSNEQRRLTVNGYGFFVFL